MLAPGMAKAAGLTSLSLATNGLGQAAAAALAGALVDHPKIKYLVRR